MSTFNSGLWGSTLPGGATSVGSTLVSDVLYRALRIAGVLRAPGRGYSAAEQNDAFNCLNAMLDSWNTESLSIFALARSVYNTVATQQTYQIGNGAPDFNAPRPPVIVDAGYISLANPAQPLEIPMEVLTIDQWASIPVKNVQSTLALKLYYEPTFPYGTITIWPIPTIANQLAIYAWQALTTFSTPGDRVVFPPGYLAAIEYNLAVELAATYFREAQISELAIERAKEYKANIMRLNIRPLDMTVDAALLPRQRPFNWLTGDTTR